MDSSRKSKQKFETTLSVNRNHVEAQTAGDVWEIPLSPFALPTHSEFMVMHGLGYDSTTDDYKVFSILFWDPQSQRDTDATDMFVSVYSLRNNSWRKLPNSPYNDAEFHNYHWLANSSTIVALNLATEEFNEMELPDSIVNKGAGFCDLLVVGGKVGLLGIGGVLFEYDDDEVDVYDVDERRCIKVRIVGGPSRFRFDVGGQQPLLIWGSNKDLQAIPIPSYKASDVKDIFNLVIQVYGIKKVLKQVDNRVYAIGDRC
ncbi:hypothetical protein L1987_65645 [Smallanthus sonchifolius]|uniref:Uncharacterized protein n=1 Tax=Smallanthus sonchifolius TaxID=185202 RepID=A0ACB9BV38_9ASTR|nr:hypothetical protein L1987_65645 [Smallanthus sonchifolius]